MSDEFDGNEPPTPPSPDYPTTHGTPSDAGQVSDKELPKNLQIELSLMLVSGELLGKVSCDELTSIGFIRQLVPKLFPDARSKGRLQSCAPSLTVDSFDLVSNGARICDNSYFKIHRLCPPELKESEETERPLPLPPTIYKGLKTI